MKQTILSAILILLATVQPALGQRSGRYQLVRISEPTAAQLELLATLDADHRHAEGGAEGEITIALHEDDLNRLRLAGARWSVLIEDMERFYADRARVDLERMRKNQGPRLLSSSAPVNFTLGSAGGFYTLTELDSVLQAMATGYPSLVKSFVIGMSTEGRPITGLRLSTRLEGDTTVPEVLYTAMHHAREPAGMTNLVYTMWTLLEGYGSDPEITWLLENRALYFLPNVNPDGYNVNLEQSPDGGGMWRRNMRALGDSAVDLNRNYGPVEYWDRENGGSSVDPRSALYRGPAPFSEPETRAIRDFVLQHRFVVALNHHSFSNLMVWPFDWSSDPIPDSTYYRVVTPLLTTETGFAQGNDMVTVGYTTRGVSDEWLYSFGNPNARVISWSPETGSLDDGFWPLPSRIVPLAASTLRMNLLAAAIAGAAPRVSSWERVDSTGTSGLRVMITNIGRAAMTNQGRIELDGNPASSLVYPSLPSLGTRDVFLGFPEASMTGEAPRPSLDIIFKTVSGEEEFRESIRPMVHPMERVLADDFESPLFNWSVGGWGTEEIEGRGRVFSDSPQRNYEENSTPVILQLVDPVSLAGLDAAELSFDARWVILARYHEGWIEVRSTGSSNWEKLEGENLQVPFIESDQIRNRLRGDRGEWARYHLSLDRYIGKEIELRFVLTAPQAEVDTTFDGIMLDNLVITGTRSPSAVVPRDTRPKKLGLHLYPNPFGDRLDLHLENAGSDTEVRLVDAFGRTVRRENGTRVSFDTGDLPEGFYTAVVTSRLGVVREKVVLVRGAVGN